MGYSLPILTLNPDNPRTISKDSFEKLKAKIKSNPKQLEARPIVHKDDVIYGGNQRYRALQELVKDGFALSPKYFFDATDWTIDEIKQFLITDNVSDGDWDWDILANDWDSEQLDDWGVPVPEPEPDEPESKVQSELVCPECGHHDILSAFKDEA